MYQRYYDGYPSDTYIPTGQNEFISEEATQNTTDDARENTHAELSVPMVPGKKIQVETASPTKSGLFSSIKSDDILLIALLIILATEAPDDTIMPLIIGYIFLSDILPI